MKRRYRCWTRSAPVVVLLLLVVGTAARDVAACTRIYQPTLALDPALFIFEGRIVAIVEDSSRVAGGERFSFEQTRSGEHPRAAALLIEPIRIVYAPTEAEQFAVYPAGLGADCEPIYMTTAALESQGYVEGEQVLVTARATGPGFRPGANAMPLVVDMSSDVLVRASLLEEIGLEAASWGAEAESQDAHLSLSRRLANFGHEVRRQSDVLDELLERTEWPDGLERKWAEENAIRGRVRYEYEVDLARLHAAQTDEERLTLLFKVRFYRYHNWMQQEDCEYAALVQRHLPDSQMQTLLGAYLTLWMRRPLASYAACEQANRIREEER